MELQNNKTDFLGGIRKGLPICFGYLSVSFAFGIKAVNEGLDPLLIVFMSVTNLTSAGQAEGARIIASCGTYLEIALTTLMINIRYMLMSFSLSQKIKKGTTTAQRMIFGFGITDEIFGIAISEPKPVSAYYLYGLILTPVIGWTMGTFFGAFMSGLLPSDIAKAMNIALFAMFIAIIIPPAKKSKPIALCITTAIILSSILKVTGLLRFISQGFGLIIVTIVTSIIFAILFPVKEGKDESFD